jgi:hypothetical protein
MPRCGQQIGYCSASTAARAAFEVGLGQRQQLGPPAVTLRRRKGEEVE